MNKKPTLFQLFIASLLILLVILQLTRQSATGAEANAEPGQSQKSASDYHDHEHHDHEHNHDHDHEHDEDHHSHHDGHSHDEDDHHGHGHHHHNHAAEEGLWSISKAEILRQTMITYRPAKQGQYKEYWVGKGIKWQDLALPDRAVVNIGQSSPLETLVDGKPQDLQYSQTAEEEGWKIVAVFSNQEDQSASEHHTYLFVIKEDGQGLVIEPVTKDDKSISFTSQVDEELVSSFVQVVAGP